MLLLDEEHYHETKNIVLGRSNKSPLVMELSDWFVRTYSVKLLNIEFDKMSTLNTKRHRLSVILENPEDYQKMHVSVHMPKKEYQKEIADEFQKLAAKYSFATEEQLEDLFVFYIDFSDEVKMTVCQNAAKEVERVIKVKFSAVWDVFTSFGKLFVFYYSDSDIINNEGNGISKAITEEYFSIVKKNDELNYLTIDNIWLKFDSKENLDKNYNGSFQNYIR
jgi:hypothetical protein